MVAVSLAVAAIPEGLATVMNYLKELCRSGLLRKAKAGHYEKVIYDKSEKSNENDNEPPAQNCNG